MPAAVKRRNIGVAPHAAAPTRPKRIRLAPQTRAERILASALAAFARRGFVATTIEEIARGAGLAKSGFYAHFRSKEELLGALLRRHLLAEGAVRFDACDTVESFVERFVAACYARFDDPQLQLVLRLALLEAHRIPELIDQWRRDIAYPYMEAQVEVLRAAVVRGQLAPGPILENFAFAYSPAFHWTLALGPAVASGDAPGLSLELHQQLHRQMLLSLMRAPGRDDEER